MIKKLSLLGVLFTLLFTFSVCKKLEKYDETGGAYQIIFACTPS